MAKTNKKTREIINPNDIISESRNKINENFKTPDVDTLAISLKIADKVDILRVHTPIEHQNALLVERSLNNQYI